MMDKTISSFAEAVEDVRDGASMMISGFGGAGLPVHLIEAVLDAGVKELTIISNNAGSKGLGIAKLVKAGRVRKVIRSEEQTSELQSLMRISYAVLCLKKNTNS